MPQKFANRAKSLLQSTINSSATSLAVASGDADEFPVADTGTDPVNTAGKDWFKLVLIDTSGNYEIMYARSRTLGSATISNIIRGQDGTTAIGFNSGSFVVQDFTAGDFNGLLATQASQATQISDRVTKAEIQNNTYTAFTTAGSGSAYTLNAVPDAATYQAAQAFDLTFHAASSGTPTLAVDAQAAKSLMYLNPAGTKVSVGTLIPANWRSKVIYDGVDFVVQTMPSQLPVFLRNYHQGFTLSTPGSSTSMTVGAGQCADSTNTAMIDLAASINKTTGAWAVGSGNGGLDTGSIAADTWYYFYAIRRPDTGVVDVLISLSATAPTMPTNYTQRRIICAWRTNGSSQWENWDQYGDEVVYKTPFIVLGQAITTTRSNVAIAIPPIRVNANLRFTASAGAAVANIVVTDPTSTDVSSVGSGYSAPAGSAAVSQLRISLPAGNLGVKDLFVASSAVTVAAWGFSLSEMKGR